MNASENPGRNATGEGILDAFNFIIYVFYFF